MIQVCETNRAIRAMAMTAVVAAVLIGRADTAFWGGGTTDIPNGTPLGNDTNQLTGVWDLTTKNWAADQVGASYLPYSNGSFIQWGSYSNLTSCTITLATNVSFSGMCGCMNTITSGYSYAFNVVNGGGYTLTPIGDPCVINPVSADATRGITVRAPLVGSTPIEKTGFGTLNIAADSDSYTGELRVREGKVATGTYKLRGVTNALVSGRVSYPANPTYGANAFSYGTWSMGAQDSATADLVSDDLRVVLNNGNFAYNARSKTVETMGSIDLETWGGIGYYGSYPGGVLILSNAVAGISRGSKGIGVGQYQATENFGQAKTAIRVLHGVPTDVLLPWMTTARCEFMTVDSANDNTLTPVIPEYAEPDLSQWASLYGPSSNVRVGTNDTVTLSGQIADDLTINTLAFLNKGKATVVMADGKTLNLASGAIIQRAIASGSLQVVSNGFLTVGTDRLYLYTQDSNAGGDLYLYSAITGRFDVVTTGKGSAIHFRGADSNSYSGTTYVSFGTLFLNKTGGAIAIPGPLVIRFGGAANATGYDNEIAPTSDVTIEECGVLACRAQTFGGTVTLTGGTLMLYNYTDVFNKSGTGLVFNGGWIAHRSSSDGTLSLQTDVRYDAASAMQAKFERYNTGKLKVQLTGGDRTFDVADSATLTNSLPEMVVDTAITSATGENNGLIKTGTGTLQLTYTNTYSGTTTVNGGTLHVAKIQAAAQSGLTAYTCGLTTTIIFPTPMAKELAIGQTISGATVKSGVTIARVLNDYEVQTSGDNNNGNSSGISTDVAVGAMERGGTLGNGAVAVNNTATLKLDAGITVTNDVSINAGGTITGAGASVGNLSVSGGTVVSDFAAAPLTASRTISLNGATLEMLGQPGLEPVVILSAAGGVFGRFATIPAGLSVTYQSNSVRVGKRVGTAIYVM